MDARNGQLQMVQKQQPFGPEVAQHRDVRIEIGVSELRHIIASDDITVKAL
ncbi:hypothetical protein [Rhizobium phaseoli]|uniref:hypothetical protein n=1 Tax=Rhizobium phaseoli TaxID=396 RepID=UPI000AD3572D|nr:hypothetical protein [Rhizobium phaseoli]